MTRRAIFYLSCNPWDSIKQREQHLCEGLSKYYDVYYIELEGGSRRSISWWLRCPRYTEKSISEYLHIISIPNFLPPGFVYKYKLIQIYVDLYLDIVVRLVIRKHVKSKNYILGIGHPRYPIARLQASLIYYDCMDNFPEFNPKNSLWMANRHKDIEKYANIIVVSSNELAQLFPSRKDIITINNGVNTNDFLLPISARPNDLPSNKPLIGYYGTISHWFDTDSLIEAAKRRSNYTFVLIGPCGDTGALARLKSIANIKYLGEKSYYELKNYLAFFDVALIPFKINNLTLYVNPTKVYEYFAMGKPVVASPLPSLREFDSQIRYYISGEELADAIDDLLQNPPNAQELKKIAQLNTWNKRVEQLRKLLEQYG